MQRSHPSWSWSPGAECARQGQGSAPGLCWEAQSRIKHSPPARKGGDQSCHCWKNRAGKKNPSSPCLACSTACLGFVSLGSQRSLLQSPECVWLLNSAAQKGDQDLFASPGQILLLCDSSVASATRSTWCLLGFVRQVPESCASAPTSCCFHLHPGERGEVSGARLMLQDVPVRYPCWRLEHETRDQGWRQPAGCGDCESPAKEQAHGTQPVVPSPWHPTVVPSLSAAFEAFWKWHGAGFGGPGQLSLASPCPVRCTMEQRG